MSSSPTVTRWSSPVFEVGISPSPLGTADAALASDNDNPAAPNTGRALLRRFSFEVCFDWGIVNSFHTAADARQVGRFFGATPISVPKAINAPEENFIHRQKFVEFLPKPA